ncbi:MAG: Crp/Fnr family transcriptional regulator [Piscinibacter sp.]|nr:Crp/Fnr family transcriptional regulator [Piscinibacter sp.]
MMPTITAPAPFQELLRLLGSDAPRPGAPESDPSVPLWRLRAGAPMTHEGMPADFIQVVRSGSFKCQRVAEDGYEQVLSFAGPGDVLGFDGLCRGHYPTSAVALEDSTVFALPLRELDRLRQQHPALDRGLQQALSRQLARAGEVAEMMAAVAAEVRLARFLVWLSGCMAARGQSPRRLHLRMSRRDIASLLGVAHETVSRSFTALAELGLLRVDNRDVEILDLDGLRQCTRSTRGFLDSAGRAPARPERLAA